MSRAMQLTLPILLLAISMQPCPATGVPEPGVVTIHSGGMTVELQRSHAWNIQRISYRGVEVGTPTGAYGALISVPVTGGWIGGVHTAGGIERIEEIALTVDGEAAPLEDGAEYSGERVGLQKQSMLDMVRLDATLTIENGRIIQRHTLTAVEDVVVTTVYPFMYCVTADTSHWLAMTIDGETVEGGFTNSRDLDWHEDWAWTAAYIRGKRTGILMHHRSLPGDATTLTGYWDHERHHKLYVRWDSDEEPWREGYALTGEVVVACFTAPPAVWQGVAEQAAMELIAE